MKNINKGLGYLAIATVAVTLVIMEHPLIALLVVLGGFESLS